MPRAKELLQQGKKEELWQMCCGFTDLSIDEFMAIQRRLLLEQIELLNRCELGRYIMNGAEPYSVDEFRERVPMTTYGDYCPALLEQREDILPVKPKLWIQTLGRSGEYPCKWVPISQRFWQEAGLNFSAIALLGSCREKGDVAFKDGSKLLNAAVMPPFLTGNVAFKIEEDLGFDSLW